MGVRWYHRRIIRILSMISTTSIEVLPANREMASDFVRSGWLCEIKYILAGLQDYDEDGEDDWDSALFDRFRDHVLGEETRMKQVLELLSYNVDDENTLRLVCGPDRLEKVTVHSLVNAGTFLTVGKISISCLSFISFLHGPCGSSILLKPLFCTVKNYRPSSIL